MILALKHRYMDQASGGDGDGAAGAGDNAGDGAQDATDYKALAEQLSAERDSLTNKVNELLGESKKAKASRREAEAEAARQAEEKARAQGDFEQLFQSSEQKRNDLEKQLSELQGTIEKKEIDSAAMKIAAKLADGENAGLLKEFVRRRLTVQDGDIKVTDDNGNLTVSSLDDLAKEFEGSARYASLIRGKQSSGGGASGGAGSGGAAKTMTRDEFNALDPVTKAKKMADGYKITDQ